MLIAFIVLLIGLYIGIVIYERKHPQEVPKIDNYWDVDEQLRKYKDDYFLSSSMFTTRIR